MKRQIIRIDEQKCIGCGLCINACHEGALVLENGKAKLISDSYCDGLGNCLPACPTDAITIEEREANPFDEELVKTAIDKKANVEQPHQPCSCPGSKAHTIGHTKHSETSTVTQPAISELIQWPCQIKLVPTNAPYLENCDLLIAADCTAYAYANIHRDFMKNRITLIGCPKLDDGDYTEKLTQILRNNNIKSVKVLRMQVPCCGGIVTAVKNALISSEKMIPWSIVTISTDGEILKEN